MKQTRKRVSHEGQRPDRGPEARESDAEVAFAWPVGDYWDTTAIAPVDTVSEEVVVVEDSGYGYSKRMPRKEIDEDDTLEEIVVLS